MSLVNLKTIAECVTVLTESAMGIFAAGQTINKYLNQDSTYANVEAIIAVRACGREESKINHFLDEIKQKEISLSKKRLHEIHLEYTKQQSSFNNHSATSKAMWELDVANDVDDKQRGKNVVEFMCDKNNWKRESCKFLWEFYIKNELFDVKLAPKSIHAEEELEKEDFISISP